MENKLCIIDLAPYIPFGIKIANIGLKGDIFDIYELEIENDNDKGILNVLYGVNQYPILRPLSDIHDSSKKWKEIVSEMALSNNDDYLIQKDYKTNNYLSYDFKVFLIKNHFDVFGLIEKKLAIDINKIQCVYED